MKKLFLVLITLICFAFTQSAKSIEKVPGGAIWELSNPADGGTGFSVATIGYVNANDLQLVGMELGGYTGPDNSLRLRILGNAWPANQTQPIEDVYIQFTLSPQDFSNFYADSFLFDLTSMSINSMKAEIYYSTESDFSNSAQLVFNTGNDNNYISRDEFNYFELPIDDIVDNGKTLYVRIYPWVDSDPDVRTGKYICFRNVEINGEIESIPSPAVATWYPSGSETPTMEGNIIAEMPVYGDSIEFQADTAILHHNTQGEDLTTATIKTKSGNWTAETDTAGNYFVDFVAGPKVGGMLHVDSIKLQLGGYSSGNLKSSLYYFSDGFSSTGTALFEDEALPDDYLEEFKAALDTNIATGEQIYFRLYIYNMTAESFPVMAALTNISLYGTVIGITADPPTVTTADLSYLSTTFVTSGGNIPMDGGSIVLERGVCWNTTGSPTISDDKTSDGSGSGSFVSQVTRLSPGTTYYLRAYATNLAGTSYGDEISVTTLSSIQVPTLTTESISNILVIMAESGGNISDWGGDSVSMRGICWNTTGTPTIADSYTENGKGMGSFVSTLHPLVQTTTYYVRAYATNSAGTGYGNELSFTTLAPQPDVEVVVAKDGSGDYTTVQAAFDGVPDFYTGNYTIYVKPGTYYEKLFLDENKVNVTLRGDHPDSVVFTFDDNAKTDNGSGGTVGTSGSYSCAIEPNDFKAWYITFENTNTVAQAVALRTNGDRQAFYNCKIKGFQDTYYSYGLGRTYMKNCHIEGAVDYIFGKATVYFDSCDLKVLRDGAPITAASTNENSKYGYVFKHCKIMTDQIGYDGNAINGIYLGRPWQGKPRVAYMYCYEPGTVRAQGWTSMNPGLNPIFAEYKCFGPGFQPEYRSSNIDYKGIQLTDEEASTYTIQNVLSKNTHPDFGIDWMPDTSSYKMTQSISFGSLADKTTDDAPFDVEATTSSNLEVIYESSNTDVATIDGNTITIVGAGTTDITAIQVGNYLYKPVSMSQSLTVTQGSGSSLSSVSDSDIKVFPNPAKGVLHIQLESVNVSNLMILNQIGQKIEDLEISGLIIEIPLDNYKNGVYYIKADNQVIKFVIAK